MWEDEGEAAAKGESITVNHIHTALFAFEIRDCKSNMAYRGIVRLTTDLRYSVFILYYGRCHNSP
jgi:hypothetical protein